MTIAVLGEGAWGTAFAHHLAHNGHEVLLWCHDPEVAYTINTMRTNPLFMPGITLHPLIAATTVLSQALEESCWIFEALPVQFLRAVLMQAKTAVHHDQRWVLLSKGIEADSLLFPSQILSDVLPTNSCVVLSGPSFARELINKQLTGVMIAEEHTMYTHQVQTLVTSSTLKTKSTTDSIGVQACGAFKNCIALGAGILSTLTNSDNTRGLYIAQISAEIATLVQVLGGKSTTFYTLAGIGDTLTTALSSQSKNTRVGHLLGSGQTVTEILRTVPYIPESLNTLKALNKLIERYTLILPICQTLHAIVYTNQNPVSLFAALTRSLECI
jgi:glycerol-3-phosphate dehydrogenase (NAD(P)+)